MKKIVLSAMGLAFAFSLYAKDMQELVVTTNPPMSCQNCENKIKKNIRWVKGVKDIETNIPDQRVTIEYDADKTNPQQIEDAFHKIGYQVEVIQEEACCATEGAQVPAKPTCSGTCCQSKPE